MLIALVILGWLCSAVRISGETLLCFIVHPTTSSHHFGLRFSPTLPLPYYSLLFSEWGCRLGIFRRVSDIIVTWTMYAFQNAFCHDKATDSFSSLKSAQKSLLKRIIRVHKSNHSLVEPWSVKQRNWVSHHFKSHIFVLRHFPLWGCKFSSLFFQISKVKFAIYKPFQVRF